MHLKSMIYSAILNTDLFTFFEGVMPSPSLLVVLFVLQDRVLLCHKGSLLAQCSICCPPEPTDSFLSSWQSPGVCWCIGLFFPRFRSVHFPFLNLRFLSACFFSLSKLFWRAAQSSGVSTTLSFVSSAVSVLKIFCSKYEIFKKMYFD